MPRKLISPEQAAKMAREHHAGTQTVDLATRYKITPSSAHRVLAEQRGRYQADRRKDRPAPPAKGPGPF